MTRTDYTSATDPATELRAVPRYNTTIRVQSQHLPDYFATTVDLARNGMQLQTTAPLEVGSEVEFCLQPTGPEKLQGVGRVRWTSRSKPYHAGVEFLYLDHESERNLEHFLRPSLGEDTEVLEETIAAAAESDYVESEFSINAIIIDAVESEQHLILTLVDEDEPVRWNFPYPSLVEGEVQQDKIEKVLVRPDHAERFEFHFLGTGLRPILRFQSAMPYKVSA